MSVNSSRAERIDSSLDGDAIEADHHDGVLTLRIPISEKNIEFLEANDREAFRKLVEQTSADADLVVLGFDLERLAERRGDYLLSHPYLRDVLFVRSAQPIVLS